MLIITCNFITRPLKIVLLNLVKLVRWSANTYDIRYHWIMAGIVSLMIGLIILFLEYSTEGSFLMVH